MDKDQLRARKLAQVRAAKRRAKEIQKAYIAMKRRKKRSE
jgi:hypothetical protein